MMSFFHSKKDVLAVIGIVVLLVAIIAFGIVPLTNAVRTTRIESEKTRIIQAVWQERLANQARVQDEQANIAEGLHLVPVLPNETQLIEMIGMFEQRGAERGVEVRFAAMTDEEVRAVVLKNRDKDDESDQTTYDGPQKYFTITLVGALSDVVGFVETIEYAQYYIFVDTIAIVPQKVRERIGGGTGVLSVGASTATTTQQDAAEAVPQDVVATLIARMPVELSAEENASMPAPPSE